MVEEDICLVQYIYDTSQVLRFRRTIVSMYEALPFFISNHCLPPLTSQTH